MAAALAAPLNVLVGGGTGFIGSRVVQALCASGHNVALLSRHNSASGNSSSSSSSAAAAAADTSDSGRSSIWRCAQNPAALTRITWQQIERDGLPTDTHAVVNFSGANVLDPMKSWNDEFKREVTESRVDCTAMLRDACVRSPPRVFIASSAIGAYPSEVDPPADRVFDESASLSPSTWMEQLVARWEAASELPEQCPTRRVVVRWGVVLGREGGALASMWAPFWMGAGGPVGSGTQPFPWLHIDDAAGIVLEALTNSSVRGVVNGVAPQIITNSEFASAFGAALWRPAMIPTPAFAVRWMFGGSDRANMLLEGARIVPKRLQDAGFQWRYSDVRTALRDIVASK